MALFRPNVEKLKANRDIDGLLKALEDKKDRVRSEAAKALGEIGGTIPMPKFGIVMVKLVDTFEDKSDEVRDAVSNALGKIGAPAVQPLLSAVQIKQSMPVFVGAESALAMIGAPAVEPIIGTLIGAPDPLGGFATQTLTRIGALAVDPLLASLKENDLEKSEHVIWILGKIGKKLADRVLRKRILETLIPLTGPMQFVKNPTAEDRNKLKIAAGASVALQEIAGEDFGMHPDKWMEWMKKQR